MLNMDGFSSFFAQIELCVMWLRCRGIAKKFAGACCYSSFFLFSTLSCVNEWILETILLFSCVRKMLWMLLWKFQWAKEKPCVLTIKFTVRWAELFVCSSFAQSKSAQPIRRQVERLLAAITYYEVTSNSLWLRTTVDLELLNEMQFKHAWIDSQSQSTTCKFRPLHI